MTKKILSLLILLTLTACATNPHKVEVEHGDERYLSCNTLDYELKKAEEYKVAARKDDRFMFKYMMPMNAMMSIYNINVAESRAKKRVALLTKIKIEKGCSAAPININTVNNQITPANDSHALGVMPGGSFPPPPPGYNNNTEYTSYARKLMNYQAKQESVTGEDEFSGQYPKLSTTKTAPVYSSNDEYMRSKSIANELKRRRPSENGHTQSNSDMSMIMANPGESMGL